MIKKRFQFLAVTVISLGLLSGCGSVPSETPATGDAAAGAGTAGSDDGRGVGRRDGSSSYLDGRGGADAAGRAGQGKEAEPRIHFDYNSSLITPQAAEILSQNARAIGKKSITIEGHCDERGTREYNLALGQKRADAAKQFLISQGVSASAIKTVSYGKERPLVNAHGESAWSKNRRAEILQ